MAQPAPSPSPLVVCYDGPPPPSWDLDETPVPESTLHDQALALMALLLAAWWLGIRRIFRGPPVTKIG